jgi:hypothetical protein
VATTVAVSVMMPLMILIFPFLLALALLPACALGGRLLVHAEPGFIRLTRERWTWHIVREFSFPPFEVPRVEVVATYGNRPFGSLRVTASTGSRQVDGALLDVLAPIASDLQAYFVRS